MRMAQIVVLKRAHYFSLDNDIIDVHAKTIGAIGVGIYTTLARFANRKTGECWPSLGRLAKLLDLARSTLKVYLRKLEEAGLILITRRRNAVGDPTSNRYTLLDPAPAAVDARLAARRVAAAREGGRPPADLPQTDCRSTDRLSANPKPDLDSLTTEENQQERADAAEETPTTPPAHPCPHPLDERSSFGDIAVCQHCWALIEGLEPGTEQVSEIEEGQAHATCAA
jgi:DNA-binding MarR family transcriptional regulator